MHHTTLSDIPEPILRRAVRIAELQDEMPLSPASRNDSGKISLCAAACLAYAGLEVLVSLEEARRFACLLAEPNSGVSVELAFGRLGWKPDLCRMMRIDNDRTPATLRKQRFIQAIS